MMTRKPVALLIVIGLSLILLVACDHGNPAITGTTAAVILTQTATVSPQPSPTPIPPTETPIPLAAVVNGETITMAEYQAELSRLQASTVITGTNLASNPSTSVINELIDQILLAQSAAQNGFIVDDAMLGSRIEALEAQLGGAQALNDWESAHGYTNDELRQALRRSIGAAWMRDQIINAIPETSDQVHAIQILLPTASEADEAYTELQSGTDFITLAWKFDPLTGGDLGWFPPDYLDEPAIDEAVFALQPGEYSQVIETEIGYHIFYVADRDPDHLLQPDARQALQVKALQDWLSERRNQSEIQVFLP